MIHCLYSPSQIRSALKVMANAIVQDHQVDDPLIVLGVLSGAAVVTVDLAREIAEFRLPIIIDWIKVASYHNGKKSSGKIDWQLLPSVDLKGKHVLIVEDIVDSGRTLAAIQQYCWSEGVQELRTCSMLAKQVRRVENVEVDYIGYEVPNKFIIGYGLDDAGRHREIPFIGFKTEG